MAFVTDGKRTKIDGSLNKYPHIKCFKCSEFGQYKSDYLGKDKNKNRESQSAGQDEVAMTTLQVALAVVKTEINPMWILCDNESMVDVFKNKSTLRNIRKSNRPIRLKGIEGQMIEVVEEGELMDYGQVYYNPKLTANILSFFNLTKRFKSVVYNNMGKDAFMVTRDDGTVIELRPSRKGLYYYDFTKSIKKHEQKALVVDTVEELQRRFTRREIEGTEKSRRLYVIMGRPSEEAFKLSLRRGLVMNNPVTITDYKNALTMFGKDLGTVKGKMVRNKSEHVAVDLRCFPKEKKNMVLSIDVMHPMKMIVTVVRDIRFITATFLPDRKRKTISHPLNQVINLYRGRGHVVEEVEFSEYQNPVQTVLADNEFIVLKEDLENIGIRLNVAAKEEHVPKVERQIRVVKERG